jgi:dihydrofolate synthase/folylpolyglutamate synthase
LRLCEREHIPATFFELTTALAFHHFGQPAPHGLAAGNASSRPSKKCDAVVLEVGLGGRLDATNVLTNSQTVLSIITSVQMDHTKILGNTIELIAREKAGIMKPGVDVLVGRDTPKEVLQVVALSLMISDIVTMSPGLTEMCRQSRLSYVYSRRRLGRRS